MHIEVFPNERHQWFWHFKNKGRITANAEAFPSRANAMRGAKSLVRAVLRRIDLQAAGAYIAPDFTTRVSHGVTIIEWS